MSIWDIYSDLDVAVSRKVLQRFGINVGFRHNATIGVTADVWSDIRHLQPLGKNATFATDMKPLCNHIQLVSKYAFVAKLNRFAEPFVASKAVFAFRGKSAIVRH